VISDRYLLANVVYQGYAGGLAPEDVWTVGRVTVDGVMPRLVFLLDMPAERAALRIQREHDRMEARGPEYLAKVREGFLTEARRRPDEVQIVDADRTAEAVHVDVIVAVERLLTSRGGRSPPT
jgi:dTMP kinase